MKMKAILATLLLSGSAQAADSWHIGTDNLYIQDYLSNTVSCATGLVCPQTQPITLAKIDSILLDLASNQHMGYSREIVNFSWLVPSSVTDSTNWSLIDAVLDKYEQYNIKLILALGNPLPNWAVPFTTGNGGQCWMPEPSDNTNWTTIKANLANAFGNYIKHYIGRGSAQATWAKNLLLVEGFNELDSIQSPSGCLGSNRNYGTPARNADLSGGIQYVFSTILNIAVFGQAMSSMGGAYTGYTGLSIPDIYKQYIADYYTAIANQGGYGAAYPNIHAYVGADDTQTGILNGLRPIIDKAHTGAGTTYAPYLILGETGWTQVKTAPPCSSPDTGGVGTLALPDSVRNGIYTAVVSDSTISADTWVITFWDSLQYPSPTYNSLKCNANWGIINADGTYGTAATNLFSWLKTH